MKAIPLWLAAALLATIPLVASGAEGFQASDDPQASAIWQKVRASLFEDRVITPASAELLTLDAPARAVDAAVVPIAIRWHPAPTAASPVSKLYLIIDANPSPISAIFQLAPEIGRAEIETRVRVDAYSPVRAIAELSDGRLFMATRFVKASGGCSAPAGAQAQAAIGQMSFRVDGDVGGDEPVLAQLIIDHPNHSGLAMDQATRQYTPAHFVRRVDISYRDRLLLAADVDFSISENPFLRFYFLPQGGGELRATVVDSQDQRFVSTQKLSAASR